MYLNKTIILFLSVVMFLSCKPRISEKTKDKIQSETKSNIAGNFTISGAYALYPLVQKWSDDFMKIYPAVKIVVTSGGTGQGIDNLLAKKDQLAMISRPLPLKNLKEWNMGCTR